MNNPFLVVLGSYFLCFQFVVIAYLWQDQRFYALAWINFLVCLVVRGLRHLLKKEKHSVEEQTPSVVPSQPHRHVNPYAYFSKPEKRSSHSSFRKMISFCFSLVNLSWIASLFVGVFLYTILPVQLFSFHVFLSVFLGFLFFFFVWLLLRFAPRFWSLSGAKIYLFFLFCASLLFVGQLFFYHTSDDLTQDVRGLLALSGHQDVVDPTFWTGQGEVLSSGTVDVFVQGETTGMVLWEEETLSNVSFSSISSGASSVSSGSFDKMWMMKDLGISDASSLSMMDAVVYLLSRDALELTKKTDVKFTFVSPKNPYYAYWRTAYAKHLIGTSANPSTKISCDTFFVFQGMLQGWDVSYTPATVKSALWKEAETRGILHGCVRGALMKGQNL